MLQLTVEMLIALLSEDMSYVGDKTINELRQEVLDMFDEDDTVDDPQAELTRIESMTEAEFWVEYQKPQPVAGATEEDEQQQQGAGSRLGYSLRSGYRTRETFLSSVHVDADDGVHFMRVHGCEFRALKRAGNDTIQVLLDVEAGPNRFLLPIPNGLFTNTVASKQWPFADAEGEPIDNFEEVLAKARKARIEGRKSRQHHDDFVKTIRKDFGDTISFATDNENNVHKLGGGLYNYGVTTNLVPVAKKDLTRANALKEAKKNLKGTISGTLTGEYLIKAIVPVISRQSEYTKFNGGVSGETYWCVAIGAVPSQDTKGTKLLPAELISTNGTVSPFDIELNVRYITITRVKEEVYLKTYGEDNQSMALKSKVQELAVDRLASSDNRKEELKDMKALTKEAGFKKGIIKGANADYIFQLKALGATDAEIREALIAKEAGLLTGSLNTAKSDATSESQPA